MAKKGKAKRYSDAEKKEILDFISAQGRGGQTAAVKKYKVTAATISSWKKKMGGSSTASSTKATASGSKERRALQQLDAILAEIEVTEKRLGQLQAKYAKAKAKL